MKFIDYVEHIGHPPAFLMKDDQLKPVSEMSFTVKQCQVPTDMQIARYTDCIKDAVFFELLFKYDDKIERHAYAFSFEEIASMISETTLIGVKLTEAVFSIHQEWNVAQKQYFSDKIRTCLALIDGTTITTQWSDGYGLVKNVNSYGLWPGPFAVSTEQWDIATAAHDLPGMSEKPGSPCECSRLKAGHNLYNIIIHLNDKHGWTREKIADWLDELHDRGEINIEFEPWKEENDED